jgi:hypothetical protein
VLKAVFGQHLVMPHRLHSNVLEYMYSVVCERLTPTQSACLHQALLQQDRGVFAATELLREVFPRARYCQLLDKARYTFKVLPAVRLQS